LLASLRAAQMRRTALHHHRGRRPDYRTLCNAKKALLHLAISVQLTVTHCSPDFTQVPAVVLSAHRPYRRPVKQSMLAFVVSAGNGIVVFKGSEGVAAHSCMRLQSAQRVLSGPLVCQTTITPKYPQGQQAAAA
jgi:hypothetical protein